MRKLKECKNFAELYETIGEENFGDIAQLLIMVMIASPLFWAVVNFSMISSGLSYDAYEYNDKCISIMHVIFTLITIWSMIYYIGLIEYKKPNIKKIFCCLKKENPWLIPWFALLAWTVIPIAFSAYPFGAIMGTSFLSAGYVTHVFMFGIMGCVTMISKEDLDDVFKSTVIIADILAIIMLAFEYDIPLLKDMTALGGVSVYTNQNHYAYYIAMVCLIMVGEYYKSILEGKNRKISIFYVGSFTLNIYILMINDTLGAYLAIVFTSIIVLVIWRASGRTTIGLAQIVPMMIIFIITTISVLGLIAPSKTWHLQTTIGQSLKNLWGDIFKVSHTSEGYRDAGSLRWGMWIDTIEYIKKRPIVGYGPDVMYYSATEKMSMGTPHNEYLECALYMGVPGLVLYLWGLVSLLINKCRNIKRLSTDVLIASGAAIAYLVSAFFGVRKFNTVCFFFMFIGILISEENLKKN